MRIEQAVGKFEYIIPGYRTADVYSTLLAKILAPEYLLSNASQKINQGFLAYFSLQTGLQYFR
jgi:hypothetical protein